MYNLGGGGGKKGKKGKKSAKKEEREETLSFSLDALGSFAALKVKPPLTKVRSGIAVDGMPRVNHGGLPFLPQWRWEARGRREDAHSVMHRPGPMEADRAPPPGPWPVPEKPLKQHGGFPPHRMRGRCAWGLQAEALTTIPELKAKMEHFLEKRKDVLEKKAKGIEVDEVRRCSSAACRPTTPSWDSWSDSETVSR